MINQFKKTTWSDCAVQTDTASSQSLRRSTNFNGFVGGLHRKNNETVEKLKLDNLTIGAELQLLKKSLKEEQEMKKVYEEELQN